MSKMIGIYSYRELIASPAVSLGVQLSVVRRPQFFQKYGHHTQSAQTAIIAERPAKTS